MKLYNLEQLSSISFQEVSVPEHLFYFKGTTILGFIKIKSGVFCSRTKKRINLEEDWEGDSYFIRNDKILKKASVELNFSGSFYEREFETDKEAEEFIESIKNSSGINFVNFKE